MDLSIENQKKYKKINKKLIIYKMLWKRKIIKRKNKKIRCKLVLTCSGIFYLTVIRQSAGTEVRILKRRSSLT